MKIKYDPNHFNLAAIDIGSNAARLLIKSVIRQDDDSLLIQKQQFVRFPLRLGLDVFKDGKISPEREEQFIRMIKAFRQLMLIYNVADFRACATSALRDASNGRKILRHIKHKTGIPIEIISGEEEAHTIYDNHIEKLLLESATTDDKDKTFLYVDVGGGSTEVSVIMRGQSLESRSFNIGTLRMKCGMVSTEQINTMCDEVCKMMPSTANVTIIGSGGNINKLYRLVPKNERHKDSISLDQLTKLHDQLSRQTIEERIREFDLRADRADVIVHAAQLFIAIATATRATSIAVPTIGLADGIINNLCSKMQTHN